MVPQCVVLVLETPGGVLFSLPLCDVRWANEGCLALGSGWFYFFTCHHAPVEILAWDGYGVDMNLIAPAVASARRDGRRCAICHDWALPAESGG